MALIAWKPGMREPVIAITREEQLAHDLLRLCRNYANFVPCDTTTLAGLVNFFAHTNAIGWNVEPKDIVG